MWLDEEQGFELGCTSKKESTRTGWCALYKKEQETILDLLVKCPYVRLVWYEFQGMTYCKEV